MRADAHYVDQLDAPRSAAIQMVPIAEIDAGDDVVPPVLSLTDSIKRYGVLEPLLVQARDGRYRVIAGRRRLSSAIAAGLQHVPGIVHRVGDDEARLLAAAASLSAAAGADAKAPNLAGVETDVAHSLAAVLSCTALFSDATPRLTKTISIRLIQAEVRRAICALHAVRVLRYGVASDYHLVSCREVLRRVTEIVASDARLCGAVADMSINLADGVVVRADEDLLVHGLAGVALMMATEVTGVDDARMLVSATFDPNDRLTISISQHSVAVPQTWPFLPSSASGDGPEASRLVPIRALRQTVEAYGGQLSASRLPLGSRVTVELPAQRQRW